jgi:K+-sensing histidine kinase KdpD
MIYADAQILVSALSNLIQNAFKFTLSPGHVSLKTLPTGDPVQIEIEDECGGLPSGRSSIYFACSNNEEPTELARPWARDQPPGRRG